MRIQIHSPSEKLVALCLFSTYVVPLLFSGGLCGEVYDGRHADWVFSKNYMT